MVNGRRRRLHIFHLPFTIFHPLRRLNLPTLRHHDARRLHEKIVHESHESTRIQTNAISSFVKIRAIRGQHSPCRLVTLSPCHLVTLSSPTAPQSPPPAAARCAPPA